MPDIVPWLLVGVGVVAAAVALGVYQFRVRDYRRIPQQPHRDQDPGICFYLHENNVMNLYLQGNYEALRQEVEDRTRVDTEGSVNAQFGGIGGRFGRESEKERISKYIREVGPITVIGRIVEEFERRENIVYVNLFDRVLEPGKGLDHALHANAGHRSARLSDLRSFVFVSGRFRVTDKTEETFVLAAPYGDPSDPGGEEQQVRVTCETTQLLADVPTGPFSARCLGRIQGWDPDTRRLVIDPVLAIYR